MGAYAVIKDQRGIKEGGTPVYNYRRILQLYRLQSGPGAVNFNWLIHINPAFSFIKFKEIESNKK